MAEPPFDLDSAHRWFGIELNNREAGMYALAPAVTRTPGRAAPVSQPPPGPRRARRRRRHLDTLAPDPHPRQPPGPPARSEGRPHRASPHSGPQPEDGLTRRLLEEADFEARMLLGVGGYT